MPNLKKKKKKWRKHKNNNLKQNMMNTGKNETTKK